MDAGNFHHTCRSVEVEVASCVGIRPAVMLCRRIMICVPGEVRSVAYTGSLVDPAAAGAAFAFEMDHGAFALMSPELKAMMSNATPPALMLVAKPKQKHSSELRLYGESNPSMRPCRSPALCSPAP